MELVIGTATFGSDYGVANKGEFLSEDGALEILSEAQSLGISSLDTAPAYSNAEEIIGRFHSAHPKYDCYSKISAKMHHSTAELLSSLEHSLKLMNIQTLKGLFFHNPTDLLTSNPKHIEALIDSIYESGKVEQVGASVYELNEILAIRKRHPRISLFQVPENIGDQRLRHSKEIRDFYQSGIEFHVRSVFLQGLLLMRTAPRQQLKAQPFLNKLHEAARKTSSSPLELCIQYGMQLEWASKLVIGISHTGQLHEIVTAANAPGTRLDLYEFLPEDIRDPRKWNHG
jgi:aryl-alcohol dehydrogenase-like predicted oxidoreductase